MNYERREFLLTITRTGTCLLCSGVLTSLITGCNPTIDSPSDSSIPVEDSPVVDLGKESVLQNTGSAVKKRFSSVNSGRTIIIVRTGENSFVALSAQCTHQGSEVNLPANNVLVCPSHGSRFNAITGSVIQGPASSPLTKFAATYNANDNTVTIG